MNDRIRFVTIDGKQYERLNLWRPWKEPRIQTVWVCHATCAGYEPSDEFGHVHFRFYDTEAERDECFGDGNGWYFDMEKYDAAGFFWIKFTRKPWPEEVIK